MHLIHVRDHVPTHLLLTTKQHSVSVGPVERSVRELKPAALERFCDRVLLEIDQARSDAASTSHQRYLAIYDLIREHDKELGYIFDGLSRSSAVEKLLLMHRADD